MFDQSKIIVLSKMKFLAYVIDIASFAGGLFAFPYVKDFITPYLSNYSWGIVPAAFILSWVVYRYVVTNIIYVLLAQVMSKQ